MIVAFAVGGAGLVAGSVTGLLAFGKASDLKSSCPAKVGCDQGTIDSGKTMGTVSTVAFVIGGLAAGYGLYELFTFRPAADTQVGLRVGPGSAMLGGEFR